MQLTVASTAEPNCRKLGQSAVLPVTQAVPVVVAVPTVSAAPAVPVPNAPAVPVVPDAPTVSVAPTVSAAQTASAAKIVLASTTPTTSTLAPRSSIRVVSNERLITTTSGETATQPIPASAVRQTLNQSVYSPSTKGRLLAPSTGYVQFATAEQSSLLGTQQDASTAAEQIQQNGSGFVDDTDLNLSGLISEFIVSNQPTATLASSSECFIGNEVLVNIVISLALSLMISIFISSLMYFLE